MNLWVQWKRIAPGGQASYRDDQPPFSSIQRMHTQYHRFEPVSTVLPDDRAAAVPVGGLLIGMSGGDEPGLAPDPAGELNAGRQVADAESVGNRDGRLTNGVAGWDDRRSGDRLSCHQIF
jgi:hypothetical protein